MRKVLCFLVFLSAGAVFGVELPVVTLNHEIGSRYEYDFTEDENPDYIVLDGYNFNKGYAQVNQGITKALAFKFNFSYNLKNYELSTNLDNNSFYYASSFGWEIVKNLDLDLGFKWVSREYRFDGSKNLEGMSPFLEVTYSPVKLLHFGANYNLVRENYLGGPSDYFGNRFNLWYEHRIIPLVNLRLKYHFENRDFDSNSSQRVDAFRHSISATVKIDLNKIAEK
jgi:hypothetical protein